ncbi:MAG TPA: hypothetical protein VHP31_03425 [Caproicibacter sp.]|nr:hypothetical protein [Caproicibacter sp.]
MNKKIIGTILVTAGILFMAGGLIARKVTNETRLTSCVLAAGILMFGEGVQKLSVGFLMTPEQQKQREIEVNDERNAQIRGKAVWKSYSIMRFLLPAAGFALIYAGDLTAGILVVGINLIQGLLAAGFEEYYRKRM